MVGRTSFVTHRLNDLASGLRDLRTKAYSPDSEMTVITCFPPRMRILSVPLSSSSRIFRISSVRVPKTSQTSFPTNQGHSSFITTRTPWPLKSKSRFARFLSYAILCFFCLEAEYHLIDKPARQTSNGESRLPLLLDVWYGSVGIGQISFEKEELFRGFLFFF